MTATPLISPVRPVQLTLELRTSAARQSRTRERRPFWQHVDLADVGGELHARGPGVRAVLTADRRPDGMWVGYHDLWLGSGGSSGPTRPLSTRGDALVSAAYPVMKHCEAVLAQKGTGLRADATAAGQVMRWLRQLDLL